MILLADSEGPDWTAWIRRLIWAFAIRICPKTRFRMARPKCLKEVVNILLFAEILKIKHFDVTRIRLLEKAPLYCLKHHCTP